MPLRVQNPFQKSYDITYSLNYGYNELGTGWQSGELLLGLGFKIDATGLSVAAAHEANGNKKYVSPATLVSPADLIAIGDGGGTGWLTPNYSGYSRSSLQGNHPRQTANVVFADGHTTSASNERWNAPTETARRLWNNDNQAHPETW